MSKAKETKTGFKGKLPMSGDDVRIGGLIRQIRRPSGMSQAVLAQKIGISYQQVQKYENGASTLTISRLKQISGALGTPLGFFLDEKDLFGDGGWETASGLSEEETMLIILFRQIRNRKLKQRFIKMLEEILREQREERRKR